MLKANGYIRDEFSFLRLVTLLELMDAFSFEIDKVITLETSNTCFLNSDLFILGEQGHYSLSSVAKDFLYIRSQIRIVSDLLFPSFSGRQLRMGRIVSHVNNLLREAGDSHVWQGDTVFDGMLEILKSLRFTYQRPRYQRVVSSAMMGTLATRPSEIAQLEKRDIDFGNQLIHLRHTKGQEPQTIPIYPKLLPVLEKYVSNLEKPKDPLFITKKGKQWTRKHVNQAMRQFALECGIENMTAQKMRPTVVLHLYDNGALLTHIQSLTRHKSLATLIDHYINPRKEGAREALSHLKLPM